MPSTLVAPRETRSLMYRQVPNSLTILRLVLAGVFFLVLNWYRYPHEHPEALWGAAALFILAAATDGLDGHLARKWKVESTFGRIMDPFCDKVLVIGAFIYLSGPRFVIPEAVEHDEFFTMSSGIYPWMVALMLARELLVTAIRGEVENAGIRFPARLFGKLKMILQSIGVPVILAIVWLLPRLPGHYWLVCVRDTLVYAIVVMTVLSGIPYVNAAIASLRAPQDRAA